MRETKVKLQDNVEIIWDTDEKMNQSIDYYPENQKVNPLQGTSMKHQFIITISFTK